MLTIDIIGLEGLVPVLVINDANNAVDVADAIHNGGLDVLEVTLRSDAGLEAIKNIAKHRSRFILGAGTVLSVEKCKEAIDNGAQFIVSPGFNADIVKWCLKSDIQVIPGCVTPTEIQMALDLGIKVVKFFPADVFGGISACKALAGPFRSSGLSFIPTGGVSEANLTDYADKPYIHAVGGGWLCSLTDIDIQNYSKITQVVSSSIDTFLGFNLCHIGINKPSVEESLHLTEKFQNAFHFAVSKGSSSNFVGSTIEVTNSVGLGEHGHIAILTNNIHRAAYHLQKRGFSPNPDTAKYKDKRLIAIYLTEDFGGFAIHLLQKN